MRLERPVPAWLVLIAVLATASVAAGLAFLPGLLTPKPDFELLLTYNPMIVQAGGSNTTEVRVDSVRNFTGIVSLQFTSPEGLSLGFVTEGQDKILLGKTGTSGLTVRGREVRNYTVIVTASSGSVSHSASLSVRVQNLTITSGVASFTLTQGSSGTADITMKSINGLAGNLTMQAHVCKFEPSGCHFDPDVTAALTPSSLIIGSGETTEVVLKVDVGPSATLGDKQVSVFVSKGGNSIIVVHIPLTVL